MGEYQDRETRLEQMQADSARVEALTKFINEGFPLAYEVEDPKFKALLGVAMSAYYAAVADAAKSIRRIARQR